jgi:MoxR-like ATPase
VTNGADLLDRLTTSVVGRRRASEAIVAALAAGRHLLLEGPPGTGKSTVLRAIAEQLRSGFEFVEGNAELTPARLVGTFDPASVLNDGYVPDAFLDGPLVAALRAGSLLYIEEINRIPEETLNVLITVMSEGEVHVPRLGRVAAADGFRLVAAMNPFDAVGTARIASAVYDRCCRVALGYQDLDDEVRIVERAAPEGAARLGPRAVCAAVSMVRDSREHHDLRTGSSVRGAIDFVMVASELADLRGTDVLDATVTLDAAQLALSGRIRLRDGGARSPEDIVSELWARHFSSPDDPDGADASSEGAPSSGKA